MESHGNRNITDKLDGLLAREEELLGKALLQSMKRYNDNPTKKNRVDMEDAKKALAGVRAGKGETGPCFPNLLAVLEYLKAEGWKIEKSKAYKDGRKIGRQKDGTYRQKDVDEYARLCLQKLAGATPADNVMEEKARLEARILEEKLKALALENEINAGKWILKSEAEQKHTFKLALLLTVFDNFVHGWRLNKAVDVVNGRKENMAEFRAFFKTEFRALLYEYAKQPVFTISKQAVTEAEELKLLANAD
ncbi:MAG: hypothetical protein AABZ23_02105 [Deltaproteobacteria bacterium]